MAAKIKKGDTVVVLTGKDKGKTGEVKQVLVAEERLVVEGVNQHKRHERASMNSAGGIITRESTIHRSNVALADPKDKKPTRVGFKIMADGTKARVAKRSGEVING